MFSLLDIFQVTCCNSSSGKFTILVRLLNSSSATFPSKNV